MADELNEKYLQTHLPDEPISNFKELQYFYGVLVMASRGYDAEYGTHLTQFGNADEEDSVITFDFIRDGNSLQFDSISTDTYSLNDTRQHEKIMFAQYPASSRGKEHSITQKSKKNPDVSNIVSKVDWVLDWVKEDAVQDVKGDDWLFEALEEIQEDTKLRENIKDKIREQISEPTECLLTIRVKENGEWKYPGDYPQLVTAMEERKLRKSLDKTAFSVLSKGEGRSFISGEHSDQLVGAPADSMNTFKTKQQSTFKNLRADETSWMTTPLSFAESLHIGLSDELIDELYQNVFNHRVYFLPYTTGVPTVEDSKKLYNLLKDMQEDFLDGFLQVEAFPHNKIRYFTIGLKSEQNTMYNLLYTLPRLEQPAIVNLSQRYSSNIKSITNGDLFTRRDVQYPMDKSIDKVIDQDERYKLYTFDFIFNNSQSAGWNTEKYRQVLYGTWILKALYDRYSGDFTEDDPRTILYQSTLERTPYSWDMLINECVKEIIERTNDRLGTGKPLVPVRLIAHQQATIQTLLDEGIVSVSKNGERIKSLSNKLSFMSYSEPAQDLVDAIESLPQSITDTHKYAFAVGAVVGRLAAYQRSERDMNKTIVNDHPVSRMTGDRLRQAVTLFVDKASVYNLYGYADQVNVIRELQPEIEASYGTENEVKYFYALGLAFGNSNYYRSNT